MSTPKRSKHWIILAIGAVIALVALALTWSYPSWLNALKETLPRETRVVHTGPSVSWAEMLALAKQEAIKTNPEALPSSVVFVHSSPASKWKGWRRGDDFDWTYTSTLDLNFEFDTPAGYISVSLQDAAPTQTLQVTPPNGSDDTHAGVVYSHSRDKKDVIASALGRIKLSPREALLNTRSELQKSIGASPVPGGKYQVSIGLCPMDEGVAYWSVTYIPDFAETSNYDRWSVYLIVDAETGKVYEGTCQGPMPSRDS